MDPGVIDAVVTRCVELTPTECEQFLEKGFVVVQNAFPRSIADEICNTAWAGLAEQGVHKEDPETWKQAPYTRTQGRGKRFVLKDLAPRAWQAQLDACGGADRLPHGGEQLAFGDGAIGNLCSQSEMGYVAPSPELPGWVSLHTAFQCAWHVLSFSRTACDCSTKMAGTSVTF